MHTNFSETKLTVAGDLFVNFMKGKRAVKLSVNVGKYNDSILIRKTSFEGA